MRGTARILGPEVTLDPTTAVEYELVAPVEALWDFVAIEDEVDAARFASRHGLLRRASLPDLGEPLSEWWTERDALRGVLLLAVDLAAAEGQGADAVRAVEEAWASTVPASGGRALSARAAVEAAFERALGRARFGLLGRAASAGNGRGAPFALRAHSTDLLGYIYDEAAAVLSAGAPIGRCPECGVVFVVHHRRQAYCSPKHANRARFRRFQERRAVAGSAPQRG